MTLRGRWRERRGSGRLPAERAADLRIPSTERVLAWAERVDGGTAAATDVALVLGVEECGVDGDGVPERWPWERIAKARWEQGRLEVVGSPSSATRTRTWAVDLVDGDRLAEAVRACVTASVVWSQRIQDPSAPDRRGAWIAARRPAGADDVAWTVVFDPGLDPSDEGLRRWADEQVEEVRRQTGL